MPGCFVVAMGTGANRSMILRYSRCHKIRCAERNSVYKSLLQVAPVTRHLSPVTCHGYPLPNLRQVLPAEPKLELRSCLPARGNGRKPPLLFVHGGYCDAWCWAPHFLPWFAAKGYSAY